MRMRELTEGIDLPAKTRVELKPGGVHLMLMQLQAPLAPGKNFPVTLRFRNAGTLNVTFRIDSIATEQSRNKATGVRP
jgi:copper(I)-binding protein